MKLPLPMTSKLALLGPLPFVLCTSFLALDILSLPVLGSVPGLLSSYTLVIAVFMCGVHWGQYLQQPSGQFTNLFIISNILTVMLWVAWLILPVDIFLMLALLVFIGLLYIDTRLRLRAVISKTYFRTRLIVTSVVAVFLLLSIYVI
ncbi:MAG: DUF3429 domain-containing protein [Pseudohongiella sp.]|nr:DUF3429 domain-containing protein [Pseudohongiella sp.]